MAIRVRNNANGTYTVRCGSESVIIDPRIPPPFNPGGPSPETAGPFDPRRGSPLDRPRGDGKPPEIWSPTTPGEGVNTAIYLPTRGDRPPPGAIVIRSADEIVSHLRQFCFSSDPFGKHVNFLMEPQIELKIEDLRSAAGSGKRPLGSLSLYWKSHEQEL